MCYNFYVNRTGAARAAQKGTGWESRTNRSLCKAEPYIICHCESEKAYGNAEVRRPACKVRWVSSGNRQRITFFDLPWTASGKEAVFYGKGPGIFIYLEESMKLRKKMAVLIALLLVLTAAAGCGSSSGGSGSGGGQQSGSDHYPVTITTYNYAKEPVEVTFEKCPERVICTNQTQTEMMLYFGLDDYIVGTAYLDGPIREDLQAQYDALKAAGKELTEKGYPSKEVVLALEPDFIFGWRSAFADDKLGDTTEWIEKGVGAMILRCSNNTVEKRDLEAVLADIADIGAIFNIEDKTDAYIADARKMLENIEKKVGSIDKPFTAIIIEPFQGTYYCWGSNTLTGSLVETAGAVYALPEGGDLTVEDLVNINPDVIFVDYMDEAGLTKEELQAKAIEAITSEAVLAEVSAIKEGRVMAINLTDVYGGGIRMVPSVEAMFEFMYGDK